MNHFFERRSIFQAKWYLLALMAMMIMAFALLPINKAIASKFLGAYLVCTLLYAIFFCFYKKHRIAFYLNQLSRAEKIMLMAVACYPLLLMPSIVPSENISKAWSTWGRYSYFLIFTPVYIAFKHNQAALKMTLVFSMVICAYGMGIRSIYYHYWLHAHRFFGDMNPILAGNICTVLVLSLLIFAIYSQGISRVLIVIGALFALIACVLSETRGALLSLVVSPLIALLILVNNKQKILVILAALTLALIAYLLLQHGYLTIFHLGINQVSNFIHNHSICSSWGARMAMWQNALLMLNDNFMFGSGISDWQSASKALALANPKMLTCDVIWRYTGHSIYFHTLGASGASGLLGLISMFTGMIYAIVKSAAPFFTKLLALNTIIAFMTTGISTTWTANSIFVSFFMLTAFLILAFNYRQTNAQPSL